MNGRQNGRYCKKKKKKKKNGNLSVGNRRGSEEVYGRGRDLGH